jgi:TolA-binding protein
MTNTRFWMMALACLLFVGTASAQSKKELAKRLDAVEAKNAELEQQNKALQDENTTLKEQVQTQERQINDLNKRFLKLQTMMEMMMAKNNPPKPEVIEEESQIAKNATSIEFAEKEFDFGTMKEGDKVEHTFVFTNTGDQPLKIDRARGSCGCTVPEWPKEEIAPGEEGEIKVVFNSRGKRGKQVKSVTIFANTDPVKSVIYIKAEVEEK